MATGVVRGSRVGAGPMGEEARGRTAARQTVRFFCANDHETVINFAAEAELPSEWDCPTCGLGASVDSAQRPTALRIEPYKTHLAYAKERRSADEAAELLNEALVALRQKRKTGEVLY